MRWWSLPIGLALGWFLFTLTPLWALYDLARAVQAGDEAYVERHVNFRTLRLSLVRQATAAARASTEAAEPRERIVDTAMVLAVPLVETLVTPRTVIDFLDDGRPQSVEPADEAAGPAPSRSGGLRVDGFGKLVAFYLTSEMRGFRTVVLRVPPGHGEPRQFRIRLRLRGWTWRLVDIDLPEDMRQRLAKTLAQATAPRSRNGKPSEAKPSETKPSDVKP
ncbi:hypothetical protein ASG40_11130 [Methylobacterium sp. Leaf399]|uniref:DUF2939 domain-containing protein n=1 Tax=Methylobacterium sp. Leaf399 TaxID=1736364 RepID=UPI0006FB6EEF|nr:DUF2939 domain-containing protein [Methylobacterium sp. Leaf399]KQT09182.1 hypothetical protein ASG40_11130 [Methylobacterium sp. Leaf399]